MAISNYTKCEHCHVCWLRAIQRMYLFPGRLVCRKESITDGGWCTRR